ncbi:LamG domain-containing protein [Cryomorpha ignava]|uniref:LamG domain-containing protein n=1 Tax=Cryomorpha ignava TaxID=101383 RepID=A0A7K3WPB3_9FLAO|nr:LamG domain-containing protein [Cryomorpha ignava]NEN22722.1 LamG domain-containing protein [Cryomorpha ignava]
MKPISILFLLLFTAGFSIGQDINDGLLLDYSFNGTTEDQSGNNYDGDPFGMGYTADRLGNPNSAASFDGSNDYVNFPNIAALKPELPVSFSFWIKYTSDSNQDRAVFNTSFEEDENSGVFFTSGAATNQYAVGFGNGSPFYNSSSIENYVSSGTVETNEWTHISIVVTSTSDMQIYVNCVELGGYYGGSGGSLVYSELPGCIGRHDQNTGLPAFYFEGAIDDFKY